MDKQQIRELLQQSLDDLQKEGILTPEQKEEIRETVVRETNKLVNIPLIPESMEAAIIRVILRLIERFAVKFVQNKIVNAIG